MKRAKWLIGSLMLIFLCASLAMAGGLLGDLNSDGVVDFDDFFIFAEQFGKRGEPFHPDTVRVTVRDTIRVTFYDTVRVTTPPPPVPGSDKTVLVTTAAGDRLEIVQRLLAKSRIVYTNRNADSNPGIYVVSPDGKGARISSRPAFDATWHPDGSKILYFDVDGPQIYTINPDGSGEKRVAEGGFPSWSPDGSTILFGRYVSDVYTLFTVKADGTGERILTGVKFARWSPNGRLTIFVADNTSLLVYLINPDGTGQKLMGTLQSGLGSPSWSPDGGKMVFSYQGGIYTINADGSGQRRLTDSSGYALWSPDGSTLAVVDYQNETLSTMKADGSNRQIVSRERGIYSFSWSPDGSKIVFVFSPQSGFIPPSRLHMVNPDGTNPVTIVQGEGDDRFRSVSWSPFTP